METLCIFLVIVCLCDYCTGKIPNWLLGVMLAAGIGYGGVCGGVWGAVLFPAESCVVMFFLYPLFKIGVLGAGDVKLYGICAGYLPLNKFVLFFFLSLLFAAMISLIKMIKESNAIERISYLCEYLISVIQNRRFHYYFESVKEQKRAGICLTGPILCSILLYMGGIY